MTGRSIGVSRALNDNLMMFWIFETKGLTY